MIYQKDKYGEQENLAELEGISGQQQHYSVAPSSPSSTSNQGVRRLLVKTLQILTLLRCRSALAKRSTHYGVRKKMSLL